MQPQYVYQDATRPIAERVSDLLGRLSLNEKIGQLAQIEGFKLYHKPQGCFAITDEYRQLLSGAGIGAVYGLLRADWWTERNWETGLPPRESAEAANALQEYAMTHTRWGIPVLLAEECPHGFMALGSTVFPTGLGLASTWNPTLIRRMASAIALEMRSSGVHIGYGPVLDLAQDPRWSRVEEGYGEDPRLAAELGVAVVHGLQGETFAASDGKIVSTLKHFAGHGVPEGGHNSGPSHLGPRELHSLHLYPFKRAVEAGALSVMSSYNHIDGVPCAGNRRLLTEILREQWGFTGIVVSDLTGISQLHCWHRVAADEVEASALALTAGTELDLGDISYRPWLAEALARGLVHMTDIDLAVERILRLKFQLGLFERPFVPTAAPAEVMGCPANRVLAREVARQSLVLLENRAQLLPLPVTLSSIAVIGPNADSAMNQLGDYTAPQRRDAVITILDGIRQVLADQPTQVRYARGCRIRSRSRDGFTEAVDCARQSDVTILVLGGSSAPSADVEYLETGAARIDDMHGSSESDKDSGEGYDRGNLQLAGVQLDLLRELKATGKPLIVILIQGRPMILDEIAELADAVLLAWYPGMEGGGAIAEAIFGRTNPGGKLPISIPRAEGQLPVYYNSTNERKPYIDLSPAPRYPFGYGLSYTTFAYTDLTVSPPNISAGEAAQVTVTVTNSGRMAGDEIVQLYLTDNVASVVRPLRELKGFQRVQLAPGEARTVHLTLTPDDMACYNTEMALVVEPGAFTIHVGGHPEQLQSVQLTVTGNEPVSIPERA